MRAALVGLGAMALGIMMKGGETGQQGVPVAVGQEGQGHALGPSSRHHLEGVGRPQDPLVVLPVVVGLGQQQVPQAQQLRSVKGTSGQAQLLQVPQNQQQQQ